MSYQEIPTSVGCHDRAGNPLGLIGTAQQILGGSNICETSNRMEDCIKYAKKACEQVIAAGNECWGFAVSQKQVALLYTSKASDYSICDPDTGLKAHPEWTTYRRRSSFGDCQCVQGYGGGFIFMGSAYAGSCNKDVCPANSDCGQSIVCHQGYRGAANFTWNWDTEEWVGQCKSVGCGPTDNADSFPACECAIGYAGGAHGWDFKTESWTGDCKKVDCPANSDQKFPYCKCSTGFIRSDDVPNRPISWSGSVWQQTCKAVPCPRSSSRISGGLCACDIGYKGTISFSLETALFSVAGGSDDMASCKRVECPANSADAVFTDPTGVVVPVCKCNNGYKGSLLWNPNTFLWGTCSYVACPANSAGHPNCLCSSGYQGTIQWDTDSFVGSCSVLDTTPVWKDASNYTVSCRRVRGAANTLASPNTAKTEIDFVFGGSADTVNILRCDLKMQNDFTKISGSVSITPTLGTNVIDNQSIVTWNSTVVDATNGYIAIGTPFDLVSAGGQRVTAEKNQFTQTVVERSVTQTDTIRVEIHQPAGVSLTVSNLSFKVYSIPTDVVNCVRSTQTN